MDAYSFVVKIWFEPTSSQDDRGEWRGRITDVTSLEEFCFRNLSDLTDFLSARVAASGWSLIDPQSRHASTEPGIEHDVL